MASLSGVTDKGAFFLQKEYVQQLRHPVERYGDKERGEVAMSHKLEQLERLSVGLLEEPLPRIRYTVSPSYLLEAELDREWERKVRKEESYSRERAESLVHEEWRVGV